MRSMGFAFVVGLLAVACSRERPKPAPKAAPPAATAAAPVAKAKVARTKPKGDKELPTTSGEIYVGNLDAQISELERLLKATPKSSLRLRGLSDLLHARGKQRGDLGEIQRGIDLLDKAIALDPDKAKLYVDHAGQVQSLHRFRQARADLDKAKAKGASAEKIAAIQQELDWNEGKYEQAIAAIHAATKKNRNMWTLAREARLHHDLGEQAEADLAFDAAEDAIIDTSPLPVAWLDVQRGMHKVQTGQLDAAVLYFREAVRRLPTYVMANEHLAEALHLHGKDDEAMALYEKIVASSSDPEFKGALAAIYREHGRVKEADALRAKAIAGYGELLKKYPEAMYWHASEFFMGEGKDPKRAVALLEKNLTLRPNGPSHVALARAELATGDVAGARKDIDAALATPVQSGQLYWTAARVYALSAQAGDDEKSADFAARARAFNPTIAEVEPPIRTAPAK